MTMKFGKARMPPSKPRKDKAREMTNAVVLDGDKTESKDRDLIHGNGRTLGMDEDDNPKS
jgi:hypothetical protein